ncbi:MAG: GNAT family N-acetyltransferase, partial [Flavobacteriales bacterium]|nr:GNAT family N-acetyltransferase [Flavobacteriales bacterium]
KKLKRIDAIDPPVPADALRTEIEGLTEYRVLQYDPFDAYVVSASRAPLCIKEIGRLREITFRAVGEGTNRSSDLDEFDLHYDHLILWDTQALQIAGAYRLGDGRNIIERYGLQGFYTNSLFRMHPRMKAILRNSLELGRSFIVPAYQKHRLPLFLLWKGILCYLSKKQYFRYIIGPVSISNEYRDISKSLITEFVKQNYFDQHLSRYVEPRHAFRPKLPLIDTEVLVEATQHDLRKLDKMITEIEPLHVAMPVLLKKYLQQNAKILAFNSDPKFNDALDGLMLLDVKNLPSDTVENLQREMVAGTK